MNVEVGRENNNRAFSTLHSLSAFCDMYVRQQLLQRDQGANVCVLQDDITVTAAADGDGPSRCATRASVIYHLLSMSTHR